MFQDAEDPVALAVDLANSWDELEDPPELLRDVATLRRFLSRRGLGASRVGERDLVATRRLRDRLRAAFGAEDERRAVDVLNRVLREADAPRQLEEDAGEWRFRYVGPLLDVLAATTASSLLEAIRADGFERFGMCAGSPCCCVFVDRSKNRSRRFCSQLCADRVAQAARRERLRRSPR